MDGDECVEAGHMGDAAGLAAGACTISGGTWPQAVRLSSASRRPEPASTSSALELIHVAELVSDVKRR